MHGGRGFLPIDPPTLDTLRAARLSIYSYHVPMDAHATVGTTAAIVAALEGATIGQFAVHGEIALGKVCAIRSIDTVLLATRLREVFGIPYVDFEGYRRDDITLVAPISLSSRRRYIRWRRARAGRAAG